MAYDLTPLPHNIRHESPTSTTTHVYIYHENLIGRWFNALNSESQRHEPRHHHLYIPWVSLNDTHHHHPRLYTQRASLADNLTYHHRHENLTTTHVYTRKASLTNDFSPWPHNPTVMSPHPTTHAYTYPESLNSTRPHNSSDWVPHPYHHPRRYIPRGLHWQMS